MSDEKRYVVLNEASMHGHLDKALEARDELNASMAQVWGVYLVGVEVQKPDYTKLVEYVKDNRQRLHTFTSCGATGCICGLDDALKEAGLA